VTLFQTLVEYSVVLSLAYLATLAAITVVLALRVGGRREESADDYDTLSASRFTIPVSLIVPLRDDSEPVAPTLTALLALSYPEFEVIVVAEGLSAATWSALKNEWALEAKEFFYRQSLATAAVQKIYRSGRDARLMIVDKTPTGGLADAMNCGVNLARFRYVSTVESGLVFDADALLRAMSAPLRDPASVAAATSHVESYGGASDALLGDALQRLASVRALMDSRLVWRTFQAALGTHDTVAVWRRDGIVLLGGFSLDAADPDVDMMVRLQTSTTPRVTGRIVRSAEIFGQIGPRSLSSRVRLATRRQLAAWQTLWAGRTLDGRAFMYFVMSEFVTPLAQAWVLVAITAGALGGWIPWRDVALVVILLSFGHAVVNSVAVLLRGAAAGAPDESALLRLLLVAPLDFAVSGSVAAYAKGAGFWAFLKGASAPGGVA
jgi:hypothetical protein